MLKAALIVVDEVTPPDDDGNALATLLAVADERLSAVYGRLDRLGKAETADD